ncbi:MAG: sugar phosphate isomerase/epimerase [Ruminococcaceae bacterium]|nr:sugar phosphate isomerase/epimerase [Oscillospiraceae bacterium]
MKIGVSSYSFAKHVQQTGCNYLELCDLAKELGFDGIEFTDLTENEWKKLGVDNPLACATLIREKCAAIGLDVVAYTVGADLFGRDREAEAERLCACVDVAAELGAPVMRHDATFTTPTEYLVGWREVIDMIAPYIRRVAAYAAEKGVRTCTENHGYFMQAPDRVEALIRTVGHKNYGWLCDMGNFLCADADPAEAVKIAAPYTFHVHAKDFLFKDGASGPMPSGFFETNGGNYIRGTAVGHGVVPIVKCVKMLKKAGYDAYLSIEFEGMEENIPALQSGLAFLRAIV